MKSKLSLSLRLKFHASMESLQLRILSLSGNLIPLKVLLFNFNLINLELRFQTNGINYAIPDNKPATKSLKSRESN